MGADVIGPVLILDAWERMSLGACRGLGLSGIEVGIGGHDPEGDIAASSRHARRYHRLPDPTGPAEAYERALDAVVQRYGYVAIVATHDATLARLASIRLPAPTLSVLGHAWHAVQDKIALADVCARIGAAYPVTDELERPEDAAEAFHRLGAPLFVKSARSALALPDCVPFQRGAVRAESAAAAVEAAAALLHDGLPAIGQAGVEHVTKLNAVVLRRDGATELRYAHRVLREHPRGGGIGITLETIGVERGDGAEIVSILERICGATGLEGIVQAEFYRATDGRLVVVDVNPRLWGSIWFAERMGMRVVERSIRAALGLERLPPVRYPLGRRFHVVTSELHWVKAHDRRVAAALDVVRRTRPWDIFEYVHVADPWPTLVLLARARAHRRRLLSHRGSGARESNELAGEASR